MGRHHDDVARDGRADQGRAPGRFHGLPEVDPNGFTYPELDVTALPPGFDVKKLDKVLSHTNRLWFANSTDLALYYLPIQTMTGTMGVLPLNAYFKRGGTIRAITTWTLDGGAGMNSHAGDLLHQRRSRDLHRQPTPMPWTAVSSWSASIVSTAR